MQLVIWWKQRIDTNVTIMGGDKTGRFVRLADSSLRNSKSSKEELMVSTPAPSFCLHDWTQSHVQRNGAGSTTFSIAPAK
ncbi:hypothetical protein [Brevundimonas sp. M20]|uniref:hypothetical protein n=1 Tax=Brevundimonas sp. M20 TaxID=2591463 RepID=UPI001146DDFF|nr:hypothetical protein [Brevundimonas sp. M20]QDH72324.1 hypothetical protein FKQ52_02110 [Brevundimonas sp. M20]